MKITNIQYVQDGKVCSPNMVNFRNPYSIETTLFVKNVGRAVKSSHFFNLVADGDIKYKGNITVINTFKRLSTDTLNCLKVEYIMGC